MQSEIAKWSLEQSRFRGPGRRRRARSRRSATSPPPWRSSRPASSSSSSTTRTVDVGAPDMRIRSSMPTGVGPSSETIRVALGRRPARSPNSLGARLLERRFDRSAQDRINHSNNVCRGGDERGPCLMRSLAPAERGSSGEPGTANTSRPCSAAIRAVISEPERWAASTMTTPTAAPEISRLRRGKSAARGRVVERHLRDCRARAADDR